MIEKQISLQKMIESAQPILVQNKEGILYPHYLQNANTSLEMIENPRKLIEHINSLIKPLLGTQIFREEDFTNQLINQSPHLIPTLKTTLGLNMIKPQSRTQNLNMIIKDIFYFSPQSDAIRYRQRINIEQGYRKEKSFDEIETSESAEKRIVLYEPKIIGEINSLEDLTSKIQVQLYLSKTV